MSMATFPLPKSPSARHTLLVSPAPRSGLGRAGARVLVVRSAIGAREEVNIGSCYRFRTDDDGVVDVVVGKKDGGYAVGIEVPFVPGSGKKGGLVLSWGWRSISLDSNEGGGLTAMPFALDASRGYTAELEFNACQAPFYLSFSLNDAAGSEIRTHRKTRFRVPVGIGPGRPVPLGFSVSQDGVANFALFSKNAESVVLCLYDGNDSEPALGIELDPYVNRTSNVWHVSLQSIREYVSYGYCCKGPILPQKGSQFNMRPVLLDPYAKVIVNCAPDQGENVPFVKRLASLANEPSFDWGADEHPSFPMEKLVVYRVNVGLFTNDMSSGLPKNVAGTFSGLTKKIGHFTALGVNAVLLEPVFPCDELKGPYFPFHFFSPTNLYGNQGDCISAIKSMKEMIKAMHAQGIEVLLEVVFSHTSERGDTEPQVISIRGIDNAYIVEGDIGSGASNALNCNHPVTQKLILDSLRHWVVEFHVDGFCFINSSFLIRGQNGESLSRPPLCEAIAFDPALSKTKIIADAWSPLDMSCMEIQLPHWKRWAEMNTRFSIDIRKFLRGEALLSDLATRLCGSGDLFSARGPAFSFNYVTRNCGLTLVDLVSFSSNEIASEFSWNCGEEGLTENHLVLETRLRQIRNFIFILFVSLGVPVLNMGDEFGHSTGGSPLYEDREPINWNRLRTTYCKEVTKFIKYLTSFRSRRGDIFQRKQFLKVGNIAWHGSELSELQWEDPTCKFLCMSLKAGINEKEPDPFNCDLFTCFNASEVAESAILPAQPEGFVWLRLVDTSLPFPGFFAHESDPSVHQATGLSSYEIKAHSCVLFESKRVVT